MRFHRASPLTLLFLALIVIGTCVTFGAGRPITFARSPSSSGSQIVAIAQAIENGQPEPGWPGGCVSSGKCVRYSWGGGHPSIGPTEGTCKNYKGPKGSPPCKVAADGTNGVIGVDCAGFTRWVYDLAYHMDVLGAGQAKNQLKQKYIMKVSTGSQLPGDLVFYGKDPEDDSTIYHVGIYIGNGLMVNAPHTYDLSSGKWVPVYVRTQPVFTDVFGYYRYVPPSTSGDWSMFGYDAANSRYNSHETILSPSTVGKLLKGWSALGGGDTNSPAVVNGVAYVGGVDGKLYAFNASTGAALWSSNAIGGAVFSSPAVANGVVYVGSDDGNLYALNATKPAPPLWKYLTGGAVDSSPAVANGVVYVGSSDGNVYAINASTGKSSWPSPYATGGVVDSSPAVADGIVYVGSSDDNLYAINASTGKSSWPLISFYCSPGSPAVANGVVYVATACGDLYAINASTGAILWTEHTVGEATGSPAVANGVVYVGYTYGNYASLYAFDATKQAPPLWSYLTDGYGIAGPAAVANGVVYIGSNFGSLYALNASTGASLWTYPSSGMVWESPAVANGTVYVGEFAGYLDAFHL